MMRECNGCPLMLSGGVNDYCDECVVLRDGFAMATLPAVYGSWTTAQAEEGDIVTAGICSLIAEDCYQMADAMLGVRKE